MNLWIFECVSEKGAQCFSAAHWTYFHLSLVQLKYLIWACTCEIDHWQEEPAELLVMSYLIFSNNYINCLYGIVYFGSFLCRDAVSAGSWVPLLAVVREDVVKLSTINVEKRTELCFSFLIPSSEFIFSCNNILLLCTWAINPSGKYSM